MVHRRRQHVKITGPSSAPRPILKVKFLPYISFASAEQYYSVTLVLAITALSFKGSVYSRINSVRSPRLGAGNFSEPRLMPQVGRVHEVMCA
jgi:hypothetical protein